MVKLLIFRCVYTNALIIPLEAKINACVDHLFELGEEECALILNELKLPHPFRVAAISIGI